MDILESKIGDYLDALSSKSPIPGGGGASALAGAYGAGLGLMVCNLTLGKKKYEEHQERIEKCFNKLKELRESFIALSEADEEAFLPLSRAYSLPKESDEEKLKRAETLELCLSEACEPPLRVMEKACEALIYLEELAKYGSRLAVSDVGVAVQFISTALSGAIMNVHINAGMLKDRDKAEGYEEYAQKLLEDGSHKVYWIYEMVEKALKKC